MQQWSGDIPPGLEWLRSTTRGRSWLNGLPGVVDQLAARWSLTPGPAFSDAFVSLVLRVQRDDGPSAVLKVQFPHRESDHEAAALLTWGGEGAVALLEHDPSRHALLIERCEPGAHLSTVDADGALDVMIALLPRIWLPAEEPFGTLADEAGHWARDMMRRRDDPDHPLERRFVDAALDALDALAATQGEQVLLHQDLHGDNVLSARREPWLVIDPKPLVGEREFGLASVIRSYEFGHSRQQVLRRLDRLAGELGLDRERARLWAFAHTVAWGFEADRVLPQHMETAGWLLAAG
jgi:streptomycin 6-kinase